MPDLESLALEYVVFKTIRCRVQVPLLCLKRASYVKILLCVLKGIGGHAAVVQGIDETASVVLYNIGHHVSYALMS